MAEISLFNQYHGKENTITNYCGLMLKILYQYSPLKFQECINNLSSSEEQVLVEPIFKQQSNHSESNQNRSIADLEISQNAFKIIFEVKNYDWFYDEQFEKYIHNIKRKEGELIFFIALTKEYSNEDKFNIIKDKMQEKNIIFNPITFEDFLKELKSVENSVKNEVYSRFLSEFEHFLENGDLLPTWRYLLDVVNCAGSKKMIEDYNIYTCPNTGGAYNHNRAKYFGPYNNKNVDSIYEVDAVLIVKSQDENIIVDSVKYQNKPLEMDEMKMRVDEYFSNNIEVRNELKNSSYDLQVFLLSDKKETNFRKSSKGGLFGSKKYFWGIAKDYKNSEELANELFGKTWEEKLS